jgi:peptidyl-prolyl cis-trans isomerase SurA
MLSGCRACRREAQPAQTADGGVGEREQLPGSAQAPAAPVRQVVRQAPVGRQVAVHQILVAFRGSTAPWATAIKRTRDEALEEAKGLVAKARSGGDFAALARERSDWPFSSRNAGAIGVVTEGDQDLDPAMAGSVFGLEVGQVSDPIFSPMGFFIFKRDPMQRGRQILIAYRGVPRSPATRSRAEAEALVERLESDLKAGKDFGDLAFEQSDDLATAGRGGDLGGFIETSPMLPQIRRVMSDLKVGEISAPVDSPLGFHIVQRLE